MVNPDTDAFIEDEDDDYAEGIARDAFELDWVAGGRAYAVVERPDPDLSTPWLGEVGPTPSDGADGGGKFRIVLGGYGLGFGPAVPDGAPAVLADMIGVVLYGHQVKEDDILRITQGRTPYLGKSIRAKNVRYFPRSQRAVCAAQIER